MRHSPITEWLVYLIVFCLMLVLIDLGDSWQDAKMLYIKAVTGSIFR